MFKEFGIRIRGLMDKAFHGIKEDASKESRNYALRSVLLYAGSSDKDIKATYIADGRNTFDLAKQKPGCIIRLEVLTTSGEPVYIWYVTGTTQDKKIRIHKIGYLLPDTGTEMDSSLPLKPTLYVYDTYFPDSNEFVIGDAMQVLGGLDANTINNTFPTTVKLDVMFGGIAEKGPHKANSPLTQLVPEPQRIPV